jgi:hypothetical protein
VSSSALIKSKLISTTKVYSQVNTAAPSSTTEQTINALRANETSNGRVINVSGPNSKILAGEQSIRAYPDLRGSTSNLNLSNGVNTLESNAMLSDKLHSPSSPFSLASDRKVGFPDKALSSKLGNVTSANYDGLPPVLSSNSALNNSLDYDSPISKASSKNFLPDGTLLESSYSTKSAVGEVFVGSREKTPRSINTSY